MMRMTKKSLDRLSTIKLTSTSILGKTSPKKAKTYAKVRVKLSNIPIGLLEKNRHKRPSLEEVLNHPWFSDYKDIHALRMSSQTTAGDKFMAYTLTEPNSPKIKEEIDKYS